LFIAGKKRHPSLVELINGMMGHLIWISPTERAKGNSGKEPKNSIKWPDGEKKKTLEETQAQSGASSPLAFMN